MIPDELVERVRESADIVQIIGEYVPLKRVGSDFRGACPFHQGTHRNFSVSPTRNMYHCFVCHESGDVFSFLRKRLGMEWPEAVRSVAARVGIEIPEYSRQREGPDPREPMWEVNATAADYFSRLLWDDEAGADARTYLEKRKIDREAAARFGLGFSPREIGLLRTHMTALGFEEQRLLDAGLFVKRDESSVPRPRFVDRLMFPIHDAAGHCVGFGGRLLRAGEPKYLNSSDSQVFSKGRLLYGLHWARHSIRKENRAIIVEGYFDLVRLALAGVENVVAPLGTALTEEQVALLARYAKEVVLLYDSDTAGLKATFRAGDVLLSQGFSVLVATLPSGEDPDSFVSKKGKKGLDELFATAMDVFERKVRLLEQRGLFAELAGRRRAIDKMLPTIRAAADPVTRDIYVTRASEASGVRKEIMLAEVEAAGARAGRGMRPGSSPAGVTVSSRDAVRSADRGSRAPAVPATRRRKHVPGEVHERAILAALVQVPSRVDALAERLSDGDFLVPEYRKIFRIMVDAGGDATVESIERELSADEVPALQDIVRYGESLADIARTIDDSIRRIEARLPEQRRREIDREMPLASADEKDALLREKSTLSRPGGGSWLAVRPKTMNSGE